MSVDSVKNKLTKIEELPRSVRQIGTIEQGIRVYIEDYAYAYIHQFTEKHKDEVKVLLLRGNVCIYKGSEIIMIYGAVKCEDANVENKDELLNGKIINKTKGVAKDYFGEGEFFGWVYSQPNLGVDLVSSIEIIHKRYFNCNNFPLLIIDPIEKEEKFYIINKDQLIEQLGFFVFYEKNTRMHNYMLEYKVTKQAIENVAVEESIKTYRSIKMKENKEKDKENKKFLSMLSLISGILIVLCGVLGYGLIINMDDITELKEAYKNVSTQYDKIEENYLVLSDSDQIYLGNNVTAKEQDQIGSDTNQVTNMEVELSDEVVTNTIAQSKNELIEIPDDNVGVIDNTVIEVEEVIPEKYIVEKGDSLFNICDKFYNDREIIEEIKKINNIYNENLIYIGQELVLP